MTDPDGIHGNDREEQAACPACNPDPVAPFAIGETVYVPEANDYHAEEVPCPVCFGKLRVTIILGDGSHQPVECDFCGRGCEGPRGVVTRHSAWSVVHETKVTGVLLDYDGTWKVETGYGNRREPAEVYRNRAGAEAKRAEMFAAAVTAAERRFESHIAAKKRSHTWLVGYHRREAAGARRLMEYHEAKLSEAKE